MALGWWLMTPCGRRVGADQMRGATGLGSACIIVWDPAWHIRVCQEYVAGLMVCLNCLAGEQHLLLGVWG
jgi:hypothetical protein